MKVRGDSIAALQRLTASKRGHMAHARDPYATPLKGVAIDHVESVQIRVPTFVL